MGDGDGSPGQADTTSKATPPVWLGMAPAAFLLLWAGGYTFAALGMPYVEPMTFLMLRYALVVACLLPFAFFLRPALPGSLFDWFSLAVVGFLIQVLYFGSAYLAFARGLPAATIALITCLQPIFVAILAPWVTNEQVGLVSWIGLVLGLVGTAIVIAARGTLSFTDAEAIAITFVAPVAITAATLYEKRFGVSHHPVTSNIVQYAVGLACLLPIAVFTEQMAIDWTPELGIALAYLVVGNSIVAITLLLAMVRWGEAARVSSLFFLVPPMAALLAWAVLGEKLPEIAWLGMALAVIGVAIAGHAGNRIRRS